MFVNSQLNPVFDGLKPSSTLYINETVNRLWADGHQVYHMGFGESRFEVHSKLAKALSDSALQKSYLPARGLPELCQSVAAYYSDKLALKFRNEQVIIGPGSKSLIYGLQMVLNADLFLPTPSWVSYAPQATLLGLKHFYIPSSVEGGYSFDLNAFDQLVSASKNPNKLLVLNSPNNPTGQMLDATQLQQIGDYCRENNIWVMSDEIYFQVAHGDIPHSSIAHYYPEGTFILGGLSKHLSIGGWRLGVALLPDTEFGKTLMEKLVVLSSETWSGVSSPIQYAALLAYSGDDEIERYISDCSVIHRIRTQFVRAGLLELGIQCTKAEGAFYLTVNFDGYRDALAGQGVVTSAELSKYLLERYRIASLPGADFGIPSRTLSLRLSVSYLDMEDSPSAQRVYGLYQSGVSEAEFMATDNHPNMHAALRAFKACTDDLTIANE